MKLELLFLGKTKDSFLSEGIEEYYSRLLHYVSVSVKTLKVKSKVKWNDTITRQQEGKLLLTHVSAAAFKVVLDSRGRQFTSEKWRISLTAGSSRE